jgi:hypothetical protein
MNHPLDMQISLRLGEHGWSDFDLWFGDTHKDFCLTHIFSSPYNEIATALLRLFEGVDEVTFELHEEPGQHLWRISRIQSDQHLVDVEIRTFGDNFKTGGRADEVTTFVVQRDFFITSFLSELSKIETQLGYPRFAKDRNPAEFPYDTLKALRQQKTNRG